MAGAHGHDVTYKGVTLHQPKRWQVVTGKGFGSCTELSKTGLWSWVGGTLGKATVAMAVMGMKSIDGSGFKGRPWDASMLVLRQDVVVTTVEITTWDLMR